MSDTDELVTVYRAANPPEAEIIRAALEADGIWCRVGDPNQGGFVGVGTVEDVEVLVPASQAERARQVLENDRQRAAEA